LGAFSPLGDRLVWEGFFNYKSNTLVFDKNGLGYVNLGDFSKAHLATLLWTKHLCKVHLNVLFIDALKNYPLFYSLPSISAKNIKSRKPFFLGTADVRWTKQFLLPLLHL
jgi:hypothetical protein